MISLKTIQFDDKYTLTQGRIFITGTQALVRLSMTQWQRDQQLVTTMPTTYPVTLTERTARYVSGIKESRTAGSFWCPAFVIRGELFWGSDRIELLVEPISKKNKLRQ